MLFQRTLICSGGEFYTKDNPGALYAEALPQLAGNTKTKAMLMTARARRGEREGGGGRGGGGGPTQEENAGGTVLKSRYLTGRRHARMRSEVERTE